MHYFFLNGIARFHLVFSLKDPLQYERDYGNNNEDYYEPFCDFHSETGYPPHAHDKKNQSKYKENYRKID
jgi:hypothetical protein